MEAKKKTYLEILKTSFGNISKACDKVGISRRSVYNWMEADEEFKDAVQNIEEYIIDDVEDALLTQIKEGNTTATIFYLKTKGKHRGYTEKIENDHNVNVTNFNLGDLVKFK